MQSVLLPRSLTTFACLKPPAASQRSHHRSRVMRLRREPNNRSKPTHLKSFSATQRQSPSESEGFPVLIQPNFLMDFLSDIFCSKLPKNDDPNLLQTSSKRSQSRDQASSH